MSIIDLDSTIKEWVRNQDDVDEDSSMDIDDSSMDIDWHRVRFSTGSSSARQPQQQQQQQQHQRSWQGRGRNQNGSTRSQIVFTSNYENKTNEVQSHTFQMERKTEATVKTKLYKGFAKSGSVGIKIDVPENVSNMTGSFGSEIDIDTEDENTVKHAVSWGLNSTVKAQPHSRTTAKLCITETEYECDFDAEVYIRGTVIVRLNDGERIIQNDLATILRDENKARRFNPEGDMVRIQGTKVTWKVAGNLKFRFGISQDTSVSSVEL